MAESLDTAVAEDEGVPPDIDGGPGRNCIITDWERELLLPATADELEAWEEGVGEMPCSHSHVTTSWNLRASVGTWFMPLRQTVQEVVTECDCDRYWHPEEVCPAEGTTPAAAYRRESCQTTAQQEPGL